MDVMTTLAVQKLGRLMLRIDGRRPRLCETLYRTVERDDSMSNIARDSEIVELTDAPLFDYGDKVRANRTIRNDGTYVGKEIGEVLVKKGELGYVVSIGTFLQQFYIYGVEFLGSGYRVGMKGKELDLVRRSREGEEPSLPGAASR